MQQSVSDLRNRTGHIGSCYCWSGSVRRPHALLLVQGGEQHHAFLVTKTSYQKVCLFNTISNVLGPHSAIVAHLAAASFCLHTSNSRATPRPSRPHSVHSTYSVVTYPEPVVLAGLTASMIQPICNRKPLQPRDVFCSSQVQEWLSTSGAGRSRPTNVSEYPAYIHVNTLRSSKGLSTTLNGYTAAGADAAAGGSYSASTLVNNWAENRDLSSSTSPSNYRLKQPTNKRRTEYQAAISIPAATREKQLQQCYLGCIRHLKTPASAGAQQSRHAQLDCSAHKSSWTTSSCSEASSISYISSVTSSDRSSYISSFSSSSSRAHAGRLVVSTLNGCLEGRGMGSSTAPLRGSIMTTALQGRRLEFQQPRVGDARAKILAADGARKSHDAMMAERCRRRIQQRRGLTCSWSSMYAHDYPIASAADIKQKPLVTR